MISSPSMSLGSRLSIQVTNESTHVRVVLDGRLDERSKLDSLLSAAQKLPVVVDLGQLESISSYGVRTWCQAVRTIRERVPLALERCPEHFVNLMNLIPDTRADVRSFETYFECPKCEIEEIGRWIEVRPNLELLHQGRLPPESCQDCGGPLKPSEEPLRFLRFLGRASSSP